MRRTAAQFPFALLALLLGPAPSHAFAPAPTQETGRHWFEVLEDLEDFEEAYLSQYSTLYGFEPFEARSKSWVTAATLRELRAAWERERERVAGEIARLEADPAARALHRARRRIDRNVFFKDVDTEWVATHAPFHYVVQRPPKDDPAYYGRKAGDYAKWSEALWELFQDEYVEPLGLRRRGDHQVFVTAVLASEGAYGDYARRNKATHLPGQRAHYDPRLRVAVTYEPWAGGQKDADERRHSLMHELVHAFQHAYSADGETLPEHPWLNEGLAEYLSSGTSGSVESLRDHPLDEDAREMIAELLRDPAARELYVLALEDLLEAKSYYDVVLLALQRARGRPLAPELALSAFYRQAYLFVYYLEREAGGRHRPAFHEYLKSYFRGKGDREAFEQAFDGGDLARLETGYLEWIDDAAKGWRPRPVEVPADGASAAGPDAPPPPRYDPADLRPDLSDPERGLALAVWQVLDGRPEEARERLTTIAEELGPADARRARVARELERVQGWIDLRDRFLRWLIDEERSLTLELGERKLRAEVLAVQGGRLQLKPRSGKAREVPLSELDPLLLVREMIKARGFEHGWRRQYMDVLGDRGNWERRLPDDDPAAQALRKDAPQYPGMLSEGELTERLLALADAPLPEDGAAAEALLAEIASVLEAGAQSRVVQGAREALRPLALLCATRAAESAGMEQLFAGEVEDLGEGRVRITYALRSAEELDDFERFESLEGLPDEAARLATARFELERGVLRVTGRGGLRHVARLEGPQVLRYTLRYPQGGQPLFAGAGLCDDGAGSWLLCLGLSTVIARDVASADQRAVDGPATIVLEERYRMELRHDGEESFEVLRDGESVARVACGERLAGAPFLLFETAPRIELSGLSLEGRLAQDSLAVARAARARRRVEALGL